MIIKYNMIPNNSHNQGFDLKSHDYEIDMRDFYVQ